MQRNVLDQIQSRVIDSSHSPSAAVADCPLPVGSDNCVPTGPTTPAAAGAGECSTCRQRPAGRDGLCGPCRLLQYQKSRRKHPEPSPTLLQELRLAYVGNCREVSANLKRISGKHGWSVGCLKYEARKRGWSRERRLWTPEDLEYLQKKLGTVSVTQIARNLGRSVVSVRVKAEKMNLSVRVVEGYNISDLSEVFGVHHGRVESWARRGLLGKAHGHGGHGGNIRFTESRVVRFIRQYPREYDLSRVDQTWFKAMMFGSLSGYGDKV